MGFLAVFAFLYVFAAVYSVVPPPLGLNEETLAFIARLNKTQDDDAPVSFRHIYVDKQGQVHHSHPHSEVITITATNHVSDEAMNKAALTITWMIRYMPEAVFSRLATGEGIGLFTKAEGLTVYPEMSSHTDTPSCHGHCHGSCSHTCISDGRKYSTIGGLTLRRSYVVDDNVLCNSHDGYHKTFNAVVHEYAHQIMSHLDSHWRDRIYKAYHDIHAKGTWKLSSYAMGNQYEYWAEATGAFFLTSHLISANGGMNLCGSSHTICSSVSAVRMYLYQHDPEMFGILEYVYTGNHPNTHVPLKTCM